MMKSLLSSIGNCVRAYWAAACCALLLANIAHAQLEITEVMYNPNDENAWEWVEVRNTSGADIDLNGYLGFNLGDWDIPSPNPTINNTYAQNTVIPANGIAVIYDANYGSSANPTGNPNNFVDANFRSAWGLAPTVPLIGTNYWPELSNTNGSQGKSVGFWANVDDWRADQTPTELDPVNQPGVLTGVTTGFSHAKFYLNFSDEDTFPAVDGDSSITWTGSGDRNVGTNWYKSISGTNGATTSVEVKVPGFINSATDVGNPGIAPGGTPATPGLHFTEVMYDPGTFNGTDDLPWEWVEIYNSTATAMDLSGWVLDDNNSNATGAHTAANISSGTINPGETAILYSDALTDAQFRAAWENTSNTPLNLIPVSDWTTSRMALNNSGDKISLWNSFASYDGDNVNHANAVVTLSFLESNGFPTMSQGPSIVLADLSLDPSLGDSWSNAIEGDAFGSFKANQVAGTGGLVTLHAGGDIGSPGTFVPGTVGTPGDFNDDGLVDGRDFLVWQRDPGVGNLADWQNNYGFGSLAAVGSVPEPTSLALLALALVPVACGRKR